MRTLPITSSSYVQMYSLAPAIGQDRILCSGWPIDPEPQVALIKPPRMLVVGLGHLQEVVNMRSHSHLFQCLCSEAAYRAKSSPQQATVDTGCRSRSPPTSSQYAELRPLQHPFGTSYRKDRKTRSFMVAECTHRTASHCSSQFWRLRVLHVSLSPQLAETL